LGITAHVLVYSPMSF